MIWRTETFEMRYSGHEGFSDHVHEDLTDLLNARDAEGWELHMMHKISVGYLMIFKRENAQ